MTHVYSWQERLEASRKTSWQIADVMGGDRRPDFSRPFLPEAFARTDSLAFLDAGEKRIVNQIRGRGYAHICCLIDQFILPFVMDHARNLFNGDGLRIRTLLQFAADESKHIELFQRFQRAFDQGFGSACEAIGPSDRIRRMVLAHDPLAVALIILMVEWMIEAHYVDGAARDDSIDPLFKDLLRHHSLEEAQHARIGTLMVEALAMNRDTPGIGRAVDEFFAIAAILDAGLAEQVEYDIAAFERAAGRTLTPVERESFRRGQHHAQRWTFLWSGMRHPNFVATLDVMGHEPRKRITEAAPALC